MKIKQVRFLKSIVTLEDELSPVKDVSKKDQIFFLGRSNVGKSSVINSILGQDVARTSGQAGKTKTINFFEVNGKFECLDFPGYGFAQGGKENRERLRDMILDYLSRTLPNKVHAVMILDAAVGMMILDEEVYVYMQDRDIPVTIVLNKVDKINQREMADVMADVHKKCPEARLIYYSCQQEAKYREALLEAIFG